MIEIRILDAVHCSLNEEGYQALRHELSVKAFYWKKGQYRREKVETRKVFINRLGKDRNLVYSGHFPRIVRFLKEHDLEYRVTGNFEFLETIAPHVPGVVLRHDQQRQIEKALKKQRGVVKAPTGTGKTILACAILNGLDGYRTLYLVHTRDLLQQTYDEFYKFGLDVGRVGDGHKDFTHSVTIAMRQTLAKMEDFAELADSFDAILIDEAHHVAKEDGSYAKLLKALLAPLRLGLTATLPTDDLAIMSLEGLVGPIIDELTIQEAGKLGILAKPTIRVLKVRTVDVPKNGKYADVYQKGIVDNHRANLDIARCVEEYVKQGLSVLVNVTRIEHGQNIQEALEDLGINAPFVYAETESTDRKTIKEALNSKKVHCVISNSVWREGTNIPSLNVFVNAASGKSEIATLQGIGRGLRKTDKKDSVIIVDVFNPSHHFFLSHFGERISLYCDEGWL